MSETIEVILTGPLPGSTASGLDKLFKVHRPFEGNGQMQDVARKIFTPDNQTVAVLESSRTARGVPFPARNWQRHESDAH